MKTTAHTPGPWTVEKSSSHNGYTVWGTPDWDGNRRDVASVFMAYGLKAEERREIVSANANLISAAPDMKAALEQILMEDVFHLAVNREELSPERMRAILIEIYDIGQQAIAKAEGAAQ